MTVFISWSGDRSKAVAHVFKKHLEYVIQGLPTFMSDKDIASGTQWFQEINDRLREATFGIVCVTPENLERPWLSFEAGALGNQAERSRVVPVVFGMVKDNLPSPLNGFNAVDLNEDGFLRLVQSIHEARKVPTKWAIVEASAHRLWPDIEADLQAIPTPAEHVAAPPGFDMEGAIKEMRGLLRDLVDRQMTAGLEASAAEAALRQTHLIRTVRDSAGLPSARKLDPIQQDIVARRARMLRDAGGSPGLASELAKPSLGLVAHINSLLNAYLHGDESARDELRELGVDPDATSPLRDHVAERIAEIQRAANELEDDQPHAD